MNINLSQFVNQKVKITHRDRIIRKGIITYDPHNGGYPYIFKSTNAPANFYRQSGRYVNDTSTSSLDIVKIEPIQENLYQMRIYYDVAVRAEDSEDASLIVRNRTHDIAKDQNPKIVVLNHIQDRDDLVKRYGYLTTVRPYDSNGISNESCYDLLTDSKTKLINNLTEEQKEKIINQLSLEQIQSLLSQ